jgi:acyl-CoA thioester hydrolase
MLTGNRLPSHCHAQRDCPQTVAYRTHSTQILVAASDIDEVGHANNIVYLRWIQEVTRAHSIAVGWDFEAYRQRLGVVWVVRRHEIDYLHPVLCGDLLVLRTWIVSATAARAKRATEILTADGTIAARAMSTWCCVDVATNSATVIPEWILDAFGVERDSLET